MTSTHDHQAVPQNVVSGPESSHLHLQKHRARGSRSLFMRDLLHKDLDIIVGDFNACLEEFLPPGVDFNTLRQKFNTFKEGATTTDRALLERWLDEMHFADSGEEWARSVLGGKNLDVVSPSFVSISRFLDEVLDFFRLQPTGEREKKFGAHWHHVVDTVLEEAKARLGKEASVHERWATAPAFHLQFVRQRKAVSDASFLRAFAKWQLESFFRLAYDGRYDYLRQSDENAYTSTKAKTVIDYVFFNTSNLRPARGPDGQEKKARVVSVPSSDHAAVIGELEVIGEVIGSSSEEVVPMEEEDVVQQEPPTSTQRQQLIAQRSEELSRLTEEALEVRPVYPGPEGFELRKEQVSIGKACGPRCGPRRVHYSAVS